MNKTLVNKIGFVLIMGLMLAGCQAENSNNTNVQPAASTQEVHNVPNTPYIKGPSSPPSVKGPNQPLPTEGGSVTMQSGAMTSK